jgi:hypothetical protein
MSFLSRLFRKKKEPEAPPSPAPPQPPPVEVQREPVKAPPPAPLQREPVKPATPPPQPRVEVAPPKAAPKPSAPLAPPKVEPKSATPSLKVDPPKPAPAPPAAPPKVETPPGPQTAILESAKPVGAPEPFATQPLGAVSLPADATSDLRITPDVEAGMTPPAGPNVLTPESKAATATADLGAQTVPLANPAGGLGLEDGFFDDLLDDFESNFDAALGQGEDAPAPALADGAVEHGVVYEESPVRELFADIAANYVRSVRNFMIEINRGDTAKEWIDICQPAVLSIKRAAEKMDLHDVYKAVDDFDAVLELAASSEGRMIRGEAREELILSYSELVRLMPQAFTLDAERDQRESIIIHSLLLQIPEVRKLTVDKLYAAGLTTLDVIFLAKPEDLGATAGIPDWLCDKIVDKFQAYRREVQAVAPDASRSAERAKLATLISDLRAQQEGYERASSGWTEDAAEEKKRLRQARQDTLLQINVVLAQLGDVELIHELEKLPFERRIERLNVYLREEMQGQVPL